MYGALFRKLERNESVATENERETPDDAGQY